MQASRLGVKRPHAAADRRLLIQRIDFVLFLLCVSADRKGCKLKTQCVTVSENYNPLRVTVERSFSAWAYSVHRLDGRTAPVTSWSL